MKEGTKPNTRICYRLLLVNAASRVISQGLCQPPTIAVAIFPKLLSCTDTSPELAAAEQPHHTQHSCHSTLPASWGWGKHHGCRVAATLHPCPSASSQDNINALLRVLQHCSRPSPAAQALPSWRNDAFNPARTFFDLEQDLSPN